MVLLWHRLVDGEKKTILHTYGLVVFFPSRILLSNIREGSLQIKRAELISNLVEISSRQVFLIEFLLLLRQDRLVLVCSLEFLSLDE